jgi:very-short-patch-repair endonuclease
MRGYQFMRQKPIGDYVVDFYCSRLRLVIEIDGDSHHGRFSRDNERQEFLESMGLTVLRFHDADVKRDMTNVLMAIEGWIDDRERTTPCAPFSEGE